MSKKQKQHDKLKWKIALGFGNPQISLEKLEATEHILLKEFNDDIIVRMKDIKLRRVPVQLDDRMYDIICTEIKRRVSCPNKSKFPLLVYLIVEGMEIVKFTPPMKKETVVERVVENIEDALDEIDKIADEANEKYGETLQKLKD